MRSPYKLMSVLIFAIALTSCASSTPPGNAPPRPLPADLMTPCPAPTKPPLQREATKEKMVLILKLVLDEYGLCAGRTFELQEELLERGMQ